MRLFQFEFYREIDGRFYGFTIFFTRRKFLRNGFDDSHSFGVKGRMNRIGDFDIGYGAVCIDYETDYDISLNFVYKSFSGINHIPYTMIDESHVPSWIGRINVQIFVGNIFIGYNF